jgi:cytochrome P450
MMQVSAQYVASVDKKRVLVMVNMQFGAGHNSCPGQNLARMEISKVTATMARDFDIRQVNPGRAWSFKAHFTAVPYGWPCYVQRSNI